MPTWLSAQASEVSWIGPFISKGSESLTISSPNLMIPLKSPEEKLIYASEWQFINSRWVIFLSARKHAHHLLEKPLWESKLRSEGCSANKIKGNLKTLQDMLIMQWHLNESPFPATKLISEIFQSTGTLIITQGLYTCSVSNSRNLNSPTYLKTPLYASFPVPSVLEKKHTSNAISSSHLLPSVWVLTVDPFSGDPLM